MSFTKRFSALTILCALATLSASATSYFVSQSTGDDSNNGLSPATAFKTLAKASSLHGLKGGDAILLKRGDVWHEQFTVPASGTAQANLIIDSYGNGNYPVIDGADPVNGWRLISAGTYQTRREGATYKVFVDALYTQTVPMTAAADLSSVINTPGSFYADDDTLYVHLSDNSDPSHHTIEVSGSSHKMGIFASNRSYVQVQHVKVVRTTNSGIAFVLDYPNLDGNAGNQHNIINSAVTFNTGSSAPMPLGFDGGIMVRANTSGGSLAVAGWRITNNSVGRLDSPDGLNYNIGGIQLRGLKGALVKQNRVQTTNAMGIQDRPYGVRTSCGSNQFQNNVLWDNEGNLSAECAYDQATWNSITWSRGFGIQVQSYGYVAHNMIAHLDVSRDGKLYNGIDGNGGDHARYVSNTIIDVNSCSITVEGNAVGVSIEGGTYDSNNASGCATYMTASAGPVKLTGKMKWILNTAVPKPFSYMIENTSDRAHRYTWAQFQTLIK